MPVYDLLLKDLVDFGVSDDLIGVLNARDMAGKKKYGVRLATFNGRDALSDAVEEMIDASVYLRQAMEESFHNAQFARAYAMRSAYHGVLDVLVELFHDYRGELIE